MVSVSSRDEFQLYNPALTIVFLVLLDGSWDTTSVIRGLH